MDLYNSVSKISDSDGLCRTIVEQFLLPAFAISPVNDVNAVILLYPVAGKQ